MRWTIAFVVVWSTTALAQPVTSPSEAPGASLPSSEAPGTQTPSQAPDTQAPSEAPGTKTPSEAPGTQTPSEAPGTQEPTAQRNEPISDTSEPRVEDPEPAPEPTLTRVEPEEVPSPCRDVAKRANSSNEHRALSARISLASCMVAYATKRLMLCDCQESINEVNAVLDPSFALLDEVFALGDAATKILARHAQGELLSSLATRIVATVPPPLDGSEPAIALRETRLSMVQPLVQPWLARAQTIYAEILELARENPKLGKNPAVANAVRTSRAKLAADTAGNAR